MTGKKKDFLENKKYTDGDRFEDDAEYVFHHLIRETGQKKELSYFDSQRLEDSEEYNNKVELGDTGWYNPAESSGYDDSYSYDMEELGHTQEGDEFYL